MQKRLLDALEEARLVLEAIIRGEYCCLRHGLPYVTPGLLGEQAFCEKRLDFRLALGEEREPPPSPVQARKLLEAVLGAKRRLWTGKEEVVTVPLASIVQGVPMAGRPPAMALGEGCVAALYLVKVTGRHRLYPSDRVKAYAYALLAEAAGIACSGMKIAVVTTGEPLGLAELRGLLPEPRRPRPRAGEEAAIHVLAHDPSEEERLLSPLLAYWRMERGPAPRRGPWCGKCPYRDRCSL